MLKTIKPVPLIATFVIAAVLQLGMIVADCQQTPVKVAKKFAKAYYYLDADMGDYLCADLAKDGLVVDDYLYEKQNEAYQRGLSTNYLRHMFVKLHATAKDAGKDKVEVHLTGATRVSINPAYMLVGRFFGIGDDHSRDVTLELIKEDNNWRVCGTPFGMRPQD